MTLVGCSTLKYKVKCVPVFKNVKEGYAEGEKVQIYYNLIGTDMDYSFHIDGEKYNAYYKSGKGYEISFKMPDHDVEVTIKMSNTMSNSVNEMDE